MFGSEKKTYNSEHHKHMETLPKHLGGHGSITHIDEGALDYIIKNYDINTMLDIGCGPGGMVKLAQDKGIEAIGIDGDYTIERDVFCILHDFTEGVRIHNRIYDLGWSVEFLEHIPEKFIPNVMPSFQACKRIFVTFSNDPKPKSHFNPQEFPYWLKKFTEYGFTYDVVMSKMLREVSTMEREFVKKTGSFFINTLDQE